MVIMIDLSPRGAPYQLTIMVLLLLPACAIPADWTIQPGVRLRTSYTDNAELAPATDAHSAWIAELAPSLNIAHESPRLRLALNYAMDLQQHSRDGQRSTQMLDAGLHSEPLPDWLTFDASAAINQQSVSSFGAQTDDIRLHPANRRTVRTMALSPALRHRFPALATVALIHSRQRVTSGDLLDVRRDDSTLQLSGDHSGPGLNWSFAATRSTVEDAALPDVRSSNAALTLTDMLNSGLSVFATAGREKFDYQANGKAPEGRFHTVGMNWTPSPRSSLKAQIGKRYFGNTYGLAAEYRWRHMYWTLDYDEDISSSHGEYLRVSPAGLGDFLDQLWATRIPDRATRQQSIKLFLLISQMLGPDGNVNFLSHRYYLQKNWRMAGLYATPRSTIAVSLLSNARTAQTSSAIDSPILGPDQLALEDRTRQHALQAGWNWRVSAQSSLSVGASAQRAASLQTGRRDRNSALTLAYTRQLGRDASISIDLRRLQHSSNSSAGYREFGVGASVNLGY